MTITTKQAEWLASSNTGISSETMFSAITGVPVKYYDIPHDIHDVGRCINMLKELPEFRPLIKRVFEKHIAWMPFIDCWKELESIYKECQKFDKLTKEERRKFLRRKLNQDPYERARELISNLKTASRYLEGWRINNNSNNWSNREPKSF